MPLQRYEVTADRLADEIGTLSALEIDELPFGAIQLDLNGKITAYNRYEEKLAGRRRADVLGRNFFDEVAPCTRVRRFRGAFQAGVERKELNEVFDFTFRFPTGSREVRIRMVFTPHIQNAVWIFVTPLKPLG